jgi:hypothetical protein
VIKPRTRRERKRAAVSTVPGYENHIEPALLRRGGKVKERREEAEGAEARQHLAKRRRGGVARRADGGRADTDASAIMDGQGRAIGEMAHEREMQGFFKGQNYGPRDDEAHLQAEDRLIKERRARGGGIHIKKSHEGLLHRDLGVAAGKPIPEAKLKKAEEHAGPAEKKRIVFAENARRWNYK